jgi:hypothetical protein
MLRGGSANDYRVRAKLCLEIAKDLDSSRKVILLQMAQVWLRLAAQADRNRKSDVTYETPPRRRRGGVTPRSGDDRGNA